MWERGDVCRGESVVSPRSGGGRGLSPGVGLPLLPKLLPAVFQVEQIFWRQ